MILDRQLHKLENDNRDNTAKQKAKDEEILALKTVLEKARTSSQVTPKRNPTNQHSFDIPVEEDDSQVEEIPRDLTDIMKDNFNMWSPKKPQPRTKVPSSKTVSSQTMAGLFPSTPGEPSSVEKVSRTAASSQPTAYEESARAPELRQVGDSQSQERNNYFFDNHDLTEQNLSEVGPYSAPAISAVHGNLALDDLTARNTVSNSLGVRPNTNVARKRSAVAAGLTRSDEAREPIKATRSSTRANRWVIADSQSPKRVSSQSARPQRLTATHKKGNIWVLV